MHGQRNIIKITGVSKDCITLNFTVPPKRQ